MGGSADGARWFLINASPDLRTQIESFAPLCPRPVPVRNSPIAAVLLTNADLDHVLGLPLLREGGRLTVYAPAAVREAFGFERVMEEFCGIDWREPSAEWQPLEGELQFRAIPLSGPAPRFAPQTEIGSAAYEIIDRRTGGRAVIAPDVAAITPALLEPMAAADVILMDGTFWSDGELRTLGISERLAADMGHLPIGNGSLEVLRRLPGRHKVYLHINNTNPILQPGSPERAAVEAAGVTVGFDGWEAEL
ncbi:MAG: pyrroloquinoline quinone biosynthesis protein [Chthoniobacter sp.]|nr:pyrroloquinoline quinone biosynthesis protein [Chthoniobacter sp.]